MPVNLAILTFLGTVLCVFTVPIKDIVCHLCCLGTAKRSKYSGKLNINEHVDGDKGLEGPLSSNNTIHVRRETVIIRASPNRQ